MNEITYPYHLIIPTIISFLILVIIILNWKRLIKGNKRKLLWISITTFFLLYLFTVGSAAYEGIYAQWNVNKYDLNQDGLFSGDEITKEQTEAMKLLINDVGRNFAFLTGIIFSGLIATLVFVSGKIIQFIKK